MHISCTLTAINLSIFKFNIDFFSKYTNLKNEYKINGMYK